MYLKKSWSQCELQRLRNKKLQRHEYPSAFQKQKYFLLLWKTPLPTTTLVL
jgi:hypothetical protein